MKQIKLYNIFFPIWLLMFFPPVVLITIAGNFIIDSLVVTACYYAFKLADMQFDLKTFYKKSIFKVLGYGFLADIAGAAILFVLGIWGDSFGLPYELISGINLDPFSHPLAVVTIIFSIMVSAVLIFVFNYKFTFSRYIEERTVRLKTAVTIAILTMPWTFLLPTKWFYR